MFDEQDRVLCVIDLDTVMPNFIFSDYGDFLRTGANVVAEDCPDMDAVKLIPALKEAVKVPIVADIHFDYRLALECMKNGADKVRINPGNIGDSERVKQVVEMAKSRQRRWGRCLTSS